MSKGNWRAVLAALIAAVTLAGCQTVTNPLTGRAELNMISPQEEKQLGDSEHPKILAAYGGAYSNSRVTAYVATVGGRLAATTNATDVQWTFTVLNSPVVNAFALPGGYVYVSRGLIALANDEAELAGVIGHEIGHVTAHHIAQRQTQGVIAQGAGLLATLGAEALGVPGGGQIAHLAQASAQGYLASFSRAQELEADQLGVRYMSRVGYDPYAQAEFLGILEAQTALHAKIIGQRYDPNRVDFLASHPATPQRVRKAIAAAKASGVPVKSGAPRRKSQFRAAVDGMIYGDSPEQGFVRGRRFAHPKLRFRFDAPAGFEIRNSTRSVVAKGPDGALMAFDSGADPGGALDAYISQRWVPGIARQTRVGAISGLTTTTIGGLRAATALASLRLSSGAAIERLTVIRRGNGQIYRFTGIYPRDQATRFDKQMVAAARSFRVLSSAQAAKLKPYRIRFVKVGAGDTVKRLAARMAIDDHKVERFRVINALAAGAQPRVGDYVKIITF